jgi:transketolase
MKKNLHSNLRLKAKELRKEILNSINSAKKGHIGGSFSCLDILISLFYAKVFNLGKKYINNSNRDFFILSKGHAAISLYSIFADLGFSKNYNLKNFNKFPSYLTEHPQLHKKLPGIDFETGSLGNGVGLASGLGHALKLKKKKNKIIVLIGDGDLYEGSTWEALLFLSHLKLDNVIVLIDRNKLITLGSTENICRLEPLDKKLSSFSFNVHKVDGHNFNDLIKLQNKLKKKSTKPNIVICDTIKGKGINFIENEHTSHHRILNNKEFKLAMEDFNA